MHVSRKTPETGRPIRSLFINMNIPNKHKYRYEMLKLYRVLRLAS